MPILFTRKQTKHGNAQSSPFSYNMKMAVDGYYACKALTVRERFLNVFTPHSSLLFLFYSLELNWAITFWCNFSWHFNGLFAHSRGEDDLIDDLSVDLMAAIAPTPKSMYRTSGGYRNMAYNTGRFNPENPVKARKVWIVVWSWTRLTRHVMVWKVWNPWITESWCIQLLSCINTVLHNLSV